MRVNLKEYRFRGVQLDVKTVQFEIAFENGILRRSSGENQKCTGQEELP